MALLFHLAGAASGFLFLYIGISLNGDTRNRPINGIALLLMLLWQTYILLTTFMSYTAIHSVSDQLLTTLMLIFLLPFLLGHGRILSGTSLEKGIRQAAVYGLPFSLLALTESAGTIAAAVAGRSLAISISLPAAIFYLILGVYAAVMVFSFQKES